MNVVNPIDASVFNEKVLAKRSGSFTDYMSYFQPFIDKIDSFAIGPYFWFVPDNCSMKTVAWSENIGLLTPYLYADREDMSVASFAGMIHPDDRDYVLSAIQIAMETIETSERRDFLKFNVYGRFMNAEGCYRWVLVQFPAFYFVERVESIIVLVTDLSHLGNIELPLLTISDFRSESYQFFTASMPSKDLIALDLPLITKREREIIGLMAKGLKSPEIAEKLFISYSTVENHRKNLRIKTNTKTSSELMSFVIKNNLI